MPQNTSNIAVVVPAYNEEGTIGPTIESFHRELPSASFVIVDNNSGDGTAARARETLARLGAEGAVLFEARQGKGNAVRLAFAECEADIYVMVDGDLTYPASQVHELIRPVVENRADMVVGDRQSGGGYRKENKRKLHNFGNALVTWMVNALFAADLKDIMSGYRVMNAKFVNNYPLLVQGFEIETDITLHALDKHFRILEIPVAYRDRPTGSSSKLNTIPDGARILFTIAQILRYYRPLLFFGLLALLFCVAGLVTAVPVFHDWLSYRYIYHVPLAILAAALETVSFFLLGTGLILDSITHQHRMSYEHTIISRKK